MPNEQNLIQECPFCKKGSINITVIPSYYEMTVSRISSGTKRIPRYHEERIIVHSDCPACGKPKREIKEALERGTEDSKSHEDRLKRIRDSGLPTRIEE